MSEYEKLVDYICRLPTATGNHVTQKHVNAVSFTFSLIENNFAKLPLPTVQVTNEPAVIMAWDSGEQYIDIEIHPNGEYDWFYRNRVTREIAGTEDVREQTVGGKFIRKLKKVLDAKSKSS